MKIERPAREAKLRAARFDEIRVRCRRYRKCAAAPTVTGRFVSVRFSACAVSRTVPPLTEMPVGRAPSVLLKAALSASGPLETELPPALTAADGERIRRAQGERARVHDTAPGERIRAAQRERARAVFVRAGGAPEITAEMRSSVVVLALSPMLKVSWTPFRLRLPETVRVCGSFVRSTTAASPA